MTDKNGEFSPIKERFCAVCRRHTSETLTKSGGNSAFLDGVLVI